MDKWLIITGCVVGVALIAFLITIFWPEGCDHQVTCSSDEQCGGEVIAEKFCRDGNLWGNGQVNICRNAGACDAICETTYATILLEECENGCSNNACITQ